MPLAPGPQLGDPFPQAGEVLGVVVGAGLADPEGGVVVVVADGGRGDQHPGAGGVGLGPDDVERQRPQRLQVPAVEGVDVDVVGPVGAGADLLQRHAGLGQPGADVGQQVLDRPALLEVARLLDGVGRHGVDEGVELVPALVFSFAQVGIDHGRPC